MQALNVVLKFTERCNLNCSYCYYFNGLDQSYKEKPAILSIPTATKIVEFLTQGINEIGIKYLSISIHGGEPLLMPKDKFEALCELLFSISPKLDGFVLHLQTNGTLLDKEWIDIFRKFQIKVGISLDHSGHGSYYKTEKAIKLLQKERYDFGVLSVIDPTNDAEIIYNHLVKTLNINGIDFLWPDFTHDRRPPYSAEKYGEFINKMFNIWTINDDPNTRIRFLNSYINLFLGSEGLIYGAEEQTKEMVFISLL